MEAVELQPGAWQALLDSEEDRQLLAPIVAHLHDEDGDPVIDGDADDIRQLRGEAAELIGSCVVLIDRFWRRAAGRPEARPSQDATIGARAARAANTSDAAAPVRLADGLRERVRYLDSESRLRAR